MSLKFDANLKGLLSDYAQDFLTVFDGPPTGPVTLLNVDLSTVSAASDLIFGLGDPLREILHLDLQSAAVATKQYDLLVYNALLFRQYRVPVHSLLLFLR